MSKHTPTPWAYRRTHPMSGNAWYVIIDPNGRGPIMEVGGKDQSGQIAEAKYLVTDPAVIEANAEFIVRAVNSHERLTNLLQNAVDLITLLAHTSAYRDQLGLLEAFVVSGKEALALAKGESK